MLAFPRPEGTEEEAVRSEGRPAGRSRPERAEPQVVRSRRERAEPEVRSHPATVEHPG